MNIFLKKTKKLAAIMIIIIASMALHGCQNDAKIIEQADRYYETKKYKEALDLYFSVYEKGHPGTERKIADIYCEQLDYAEAAKWFQKAADQGIAEAQFNLGAMCYNGFGVPQDYAEAMKWFQKAADQGNAQAQNSLGVMYKNGYGVPKNYAKAKQWYRKAADQGYKNAIEALKLFR